MLSVDTSIIGVRSISIQNSSFIFDMESSCGVFFKYKIIRIVMGYVFGILLLFFFFYVISRLEWVRIKPQLLTGQVYVQSEANKHTL